MQQDEIIKFVDRFGSPIIVGNYAIYISTSTTNSPYTLEFGEIININQLFKSVFLVCIKNQQSGLLDKVPPNRVINFSLEEYTLRKLGQQ